MSEAANIPRGPALRPKVSTGMLHAVREQYGIAGNVVRDLGGSSNLNLLMEAAGHRYVARVHRTWVTSSRLADVQALVQSGGNDLVERLSKMVDVSQLIETASWNILSRPPTGEEIEYLSQWVGGSERSRTQAVRDLVWALLTSAEFRFNH